MMSDRTAGLEGIVSVMFVIASIALGTLVGASLYRGLTETFGVWQLQIGRVGSSIPAREEALNRRRVARRCSPGHFTSRGDRSRKASGHDAVLRVRE